MVYRHCFPNSEDEKEFQEWRLSSADLIPLSKFEKMPDVLQWLFYAKAEFWLDQYSKGWGYANDVLAEQRENLSIMMDNSGFRFQAIGVSKK